MMDSKTNETPNVIRCDVVAEGTACPPKVLPGYYAATPVTIGESKAALYEALSKAQGELQAACKDAVNPHFKSRYATLAAVWDVCRPVLAKHGLAVIQLPQVVYGETCEVGVRTILAHASGACLEATLTLRSRDSSPQAVGSALTYARRYALAAMVGVVADDDDDANEAQPQPTRWTPPAAPRQPPAPQRASTTTGPSRDILWQALAAIEEASEKPFAEAIQELAVISGKMTRRKKEFSAEEWKTLEAAYGAARKVVEGKEKDSADAE